MTIDPAGSLIGRALNHYRIAEKIGAGGMGEVYLARDYRLERNVAIKVLPAGTLADDAARKRFRKEAMALSRLNHPSIATIYDFGSEDGLDFLVMEYIAGSTLTDRLAAGPLPEREILELGVQIAAALEEAHEHGVVHRDLKPGNIRVTPKGNVKVLDFGLAKLLQPENEVSTIDLLSTHATGGGTLPYMSPEQLRGAPVDVRSDIYAAGVVLYEMTTRRRPFQERTAVALADEILHRVPPRPGRLRHDLSPRLEEVILKCLEKDPEKRYRSAKELGVDLLRSRAAITEVDSLSVPLERFQGKKVAKIVAIVALLIFVPLVAILSMRDLRERLFGRAKQTRIDSLAVLPLSNLSGDPTQEYFSDGMTEALIADLSRIGALRVISRTSVMQYKGTKKPMPQIAQELKVGALVEGSVQRSGDKVRITAELIDGLADRHLWGQTYESTLGDVLVLQSDVTRAIAREIKAVVTTDEQARLAKTHSVNVEANEAYLKGRFFWNKRTPEGFNNALDFFQQAIKIDPTYAPAYAGLADSYTLMQDYGLIPPNEAYPRARAAAVKAVELDETLAEAHTSLAAVMEDYFWDWSGAEKEYQRAIELNPSYETSHQWYAALLSTLGRHQEAFVEAERARDLAPLSPRINIDVAWAYYWARRYDDAKAQSLKTLELDSQFAPAYTLLGWIAVRKHLYEEAIAEFQKALGFSGDRTANQVAIAYARAMAGERIKALRTLDELQAGSQSVASYQIAVVFAGLGEKEKALASLERACYGEHDKWIGFLKIDPSFEILSSEPRFNGLLHRLNLQG